MTEPQKPQRLLHDAPKLLPSEDSFGRAPFAKRLADSMLRMPADDGFVFALSGPWGSGKTTAVNFVVHHLREAKAAGTPIVIVHFNPWWFSGRSQLMLQFFQELGAALKVHDTGAGLARLGRRLGALSSALKPVRLVPTLGPLLKEYQEVLAASAQAVGKASKLARKDVHGIRDRIDAALRQQQARIIVIIDDIDRLPGHEIRQLFQVVKAIADFPKTIYLLVFDRKVVVRSLGKVQAATGAAYLEKIIQAQLDIPMPDQSAIQKMLFEELDGALAGTPEALFDVDAWLNLYYGGVAPLVRTPRDVKRLVNAVALTYPAVVGEVNPVDFVGVQVLRLWAPTVYHYVQDHADLLAGTTGANVAAPKLDAETKAVFNRHAKAVRAANREAISGIMGRMFPKWAAACSNSRYSYDSSSEWRRMRRVCSPECFRVYFALALGLGDVARAEMMEFIDKSSEQRACEQSLLSLVTRKEPDGTPRLRPFLDRLQDYAKQEVPESHIAQIVSAVFNVGDELVDADEWSHVFV